MFIIYYYTYYVFFFFTRSQRAFSDRERKKYTDKNKPISLVYLHIARASFSVITFYISFGSVKK